MTISRPFVAIKWDPVSTNYNNVVFKQVCLLLNSHILSEKKERDGREAFMKKQFINIKTKQK